MYSCTIGTQYGPGRPSLLTAYFADCNEVAIWSAEWVRLGFTITTLDVKPAERSRQPDEWLSNSGEGPEGDDYRAFAEWATFHAVELYRARRTWLVRHPICEDIDPPYFGGSK